jgi:hypothetical protein
MRPFAYVVAFQHCDARAAPGKEVGAADTDDATTYHDNTGLGFSTGREERLSGPSSFAP